MNKIEIFVLASLFLTPCYVIISHAAAAPDAFSLHPVTNAIAHLVLSPAAIYAMLVRKTSANFGTRVNLAKTHFVLQLFAFTFMTIGGVVAYSAKEANKRPHLQTLHARTSAISATLYFLNLLGGMSTTFLSLKVDWQWRNPAHRIGGLLSVVGFGASAVLGVYSGWGSHHLGADKQFKTGGLIAVAYAALFIKALTLLRAGVKAKKKE